MDNEFLNKNEKDQKSGSDFKLDLNLDTSFLKSAAAVDFNIVVPGQNSVAQKKSEGGKEEKEEPESGSREAPQKYFSNATSIHGFGKSNVSSTSGLSIAPPPFQLKATDSSPFSGLFLNSNTSNTSLPIQRNVPPPAPRVEAPQQAPPAPQNAPPANKEKDDFLKGKYGPQQVIPGTGFGGFEAQYLPNGGNGSLKVVVRAALRFINGLEIKGGVVTATQPKLNLIANKANRMGLKAREAFCGQYQWNTAEKGDKMKEYQKRMDEVAKMWSGAHSFFIDKDDWRDVKANVAVAIQVTGSGDARFESAGGTDHLQLSAVKSPPEDAGKIGAAVEDKNKNGKIESEMVFADELKEVKHLSFKVLFANNSAQVEPFEIGKLKFIANKFKDSDKNSISNKIQLTGRASSTGDAKANDALAQKRVDAVFNHLKSFGLDGISTGRVSTQNATTTGADESPEFRSVDIIIGSGEKQNMLAHEMGHVFGLGDEYKDAGKLGEGAEHDKESQKMGGGPAVIESNDSIMSNGNEVRKQHYAAFGSALNKVTNNSQPWKIA